MAPDRISSPEGEGATSPKKSPASGVVWVMGGPDGVRPISWSVSTPRRSKDVGRRAGCTTFPRCPSRARAPPPACARLPSLPTSPPSVPHARPLLVRRRARSPRAPSPHLPQTGVAFLSPETHSRPRQREYMHLTRHSPVDEDLADAHPHKNRYVQPPVS